MPARELNSDEIVEVLAGERVVRIGFQDGDSQYLIPFGYVWLCSALYGVTELGRKTEIANGNPDVAFQVDTSNTTGLFEWSSVTGQGQFTIVTDHQTRQRVMSALQPVIAQAPDWWIRDQGPKIASGVLQVWKVSPTKVTGRRYGPS